MEILDTLDIFLNNYALVMYIFITVFGLMIGSFLNVVIYRLPIVIFTQWRTDCYDFLEINKKDQHIDKKTAKISLFKPLRSMCPNCNKLISLKDNIPIISFLLLRGSCRQCKHKISYRYPIIEFLSAVATVLTINQFGFSQVAMAVLFLTYLLITIASIDFDHLIIPDNLSYIGLWLGLLINISIFETLPFTSIYSAILGTILGYLTLWTLYWVFKLLTGKEGFGHGDFKLTALFGAWLGVEGIFPVLIIASILAIIISIISYLIKSRSFDKPFPFGPYLAFAGWIMLLFQDNWPLNNISFNPLI